MTEPALRAVVRDVHKVYWQGAVEVPVLRGVSLEVRAGEFVTILGASGSGKSTLLHLIGALDIPTGGRVDVDGQDIVSLRDRARAAARNSLIGFVFQFHHLLPEFTALENVMMPALVGRRTEKDARERAAALLEKVGLSQRLTHRPSQLSGGEQQRVAVARALVNDPAVLLLDEPTGNLDRLTGDRVFELLLDLSRDSKRSTLMVTHNEELAHRTNRTFRLVDGTLQVEQAAQST